MSNIAEVKNNERYEKQQKEKYEKNGKYGEQHQKEKDEKDVMIQNLTLENENLKQHISTLKNMILDFQNFLLNEGLKLQMKAKLGPYMTDDLTKSNNVQTKQEQN